uniref:Uncharacterized protein n=1 Tax=Aegilops tauschii subsp. strangulata TaxID=200361 RepID=A0A453AYJ2_AEGTS
GHWNGLRKTSVHEMLLGLLCRMIIFPRSILLKTICGGFHEGSPIYVLFIIGGSSNLSLSLFVRDASSSLTIRCWS